MNLFFDEAMASSTVLAGHGTFNDGPVDIESTIIRDRKSVV